MKLTGTNRPITYTTHYPANPFQKGFAPRGGTKKQDCLRPLCGSQTTNPPPAARCNRNRQQNNNTTPASIFRSDHVVTPVFPPPRPTGCGGCGHRVTAVIAWGKRPVPSRTRKLRPTAPMVLHPGGCGRVGRRRTQPKNGPPRQGVDHFFVPIHRRSEAVNCIRPECRDAGRSCDEPNLRRGGTRPDRHAIRIRRMIRS